MSTKSKDKTKSSPLAGLAKLALVAAGGGGLVAADQFGLIDTLLGGAPSAEVQAVAGVVSEVPGLSTATDLVRGVAYDGLSFVLHGAVDTVLYPLKLVKEGF